MNQMINLSTILNNEKYPSLKISRRIQTKKGQRGFIGYICGIFVLFTIAVTFLVLPAGAIQTPYSLSADSNVYVANVTYYPGAFFTGDSGTVTYQVANGNSNTSMVVSHATIIDSDFKQTSTTYDASLNLGPLQTQPFTFSLTTNAGDGNYYPTFSLTFQDGNSMHYQGPVKVDNRPLVMTIQSQPDSFTQGKKETVSIQIANPRSDDVHNVLFSVSGNDVILTPSQNYIGNLGAGTMTLVNFTVTPEAQTTLSLTVTYDNGDNPHSINTTLPIQFSTDKQQAEPVISNIAVSVKAGSYTVNGDITNAGLTTANGVTVTSLSPAVAQDPYRNYVIGALKPDDFGSFELTFTIPAGTTSVPIQESYKDKDGNVITAVRNIDLTTAQQTPQNDESGPGMLPVLFIVAIIVIGAGAYMYRKKFRKQ